MNGRSVALGRYALAANFRAPLARIGLVLVVVLALIGLLSQILRDGGWKVDPPFLFYGYALGGIFVVRSGLAEQREGELQTFLRLNFVTPVVHMLGAILSVLGSWLILTGFTFIVAAALSAGDVRMAAWFAWSYGLRIGMLLPLVLMVESVSTLRIPLFLPGVVWFAALITLTGVVGEERAIAIMSPAVEAGDFGSTVPIAVRAAGALVVGFLLVLAGTAARARFSARSALRGAVSHPLNTG